MQVPLYGKAIVATLEITSLSLSSLGHPGVTLLSLEIGREVNVSDAVLMHLPPWSGWANFEIMLGSKQSGQSIITNVIQHIFSII
jgi:hypothetical protein